MERIARDVAAETGCSLHVGRSDGYRAVTNDAALLDAVRPAVPELREAPATYITEDFSAYQRRVPGVFFLLGTGGEALHSPQFTFDESVLLTGAALLSLDLSESFSIGLGEGVTLICSILFSIHIIYIDSRAGGLDSGLLNALQFCVCAVLGFACMFIFEKPALSQFTGNLTSILYVGVFSGAIGYTFQLVGQKYASPALASLLMCLESVFAVLGGWIIGGEVLTSLEYLGCVLLLSGCVVAQLPDRRQNN